MRSRTVLITIFVLSILLAIGVACQTPAPSSSHLKTKMVQKAPPSLSITPSWLLTDGSHTASASKNTSPPKAVAPTVTTSTTTATTSPPGTGITTPKPAIVPPRNEPTTGTPGGSVQDTPIYPAPSAYEGVPLDPATGTTDGVTSAEYQAWSRVARCEEGGWIGYAGPAYPDSLGINAHNWSYYGGGSDLSPVAQIVVAERIQSNPPDSGSCAAW